MIQTAERASSNHIVDNYVYQRCLFAYYEVKPLINGKVLEIGTGSGIGIEILADSCSTLTTIDKFHCDFDFSSYPNVEFKQIEIPPLSGFENETFDYVVSFQVIEHIENDKEYVKEILRVLKPEGKFILTTPNKLQSLTRNPWHVREYTGDELANLLIQNGFSKVVKKGTYGNEKTNAYIAKNKSSVERITKFDVFNLQYRLPRKWLQIPYDLMNRLNRNLLKNQNEKLTTSITINDFYTDVQNDSCLDLFFIATK